MPPAPAVPRPCCSCPSPLVPRPPPPAGPSSPSPLPALCRDGSQACEHRDQPCRGSEHSGCLSKRAAHPGWALLPPLALALPLPGVCKLCPACPSLPCPPAAPESSLEPHAAVCTRGRRSCYGEFARGPGGRRVQESGLPGRGAVPGTLENAGGAPSGADRTHAEAGWVEPGGGGGLHQAWWGEPFGLGRAEPEPPAESRPGSG